MKSLKEAKNFDAPPGLTFKKLPPDQLTESDP